MRGLCEVLRLPHITAAGTLLAAACHTAPPPEPAAAAPPQPSPAARGEYLVKILACNDCHTPYKVGPNGPEPDMTRMLSGHPESPVLPAPRIPPADDPWNWGGAGTNTAFFGPWGVSYASNLTPEELTGMGIYTEDVFISSIRTGRHRGVARPIAPPMPWPSYSQMTDDDLKAVYAYLRTIPPVRNQVPDYDPPPGASQ